MKKRMMGLALIVAFVMLAGTALAGEVQQKLTGESGDLYVRALGHERQDRQARRF
jgi:hypothetical protein